MSRVLLFHKPHGVLCTFTGAPGQRTLAPFIPVPGVYAAGRLDADSEGLLVLTDDGALQARLTHPRFGHARTYWVQVDGDPSEAAVAALAAGVHLRDGRTLPAEARRIAPPSLPPRDPPIRVRRDIPTAWLELTLREGRNRQVRRMTAAVGHPTLRLVRAAMGPWSLDDLAPGEWREARPHRML